jgi:hypothetical protein
MYQILLEKNIKEECISLAKGTLQCFTCTLESSQLRRSFQQHSHHHFIKNYQEQNAELISRLQIPKFLHSHPKVIILVYALEYLYTSFETNNANKSPKDHDQIHNIC